MLLVVVFLVMITLVESLVLLPILVTLIDTGTLALLYHCTHYALRGGRSSNSVGCGAFSTVADYTAGYANWSYGAALL